MNIGWGQSVGAPGLAVFETWVSATRHWGNPGTSRNFMGAPSKPVLLGRGFSSQATLKNSGLRDIQVELAFRPATKLLVLGPRVARRDASVASTSVDSISRIMPRENRLLALWECFDNLAQWRSPGAWTLCDVI